MSGQYVVKTLAERRSASLPAIPCCGSTGNGEQVAQCERRSRRRTNLQVSPGGKCSTAQQYWDLTKSPQGPLNSLFIRDRLEVARVLRTLNVKSIKTIKGESPPDCKRSTLKRGTYCHSLLKITVL
jgi:hypothetical protein